MLGGPVAVYRRRSEPLRLDWDLGASASAAGQAGQMPSLALRTAQQFVLAGATAPALNLICVMLFTIAGEDPRRDLPDEGSWGL